MGAAVKRETKVGTNPGVGTAEQRRMGCVSRVYHPRGWQLQAPKRGAVSHKRTRVSVKEAHLTVRALPSTALRNVPHFPSFLRLSHRIRIDGHSHALCFLKGSP